MNNAIRVAVVGVGGRMGQALVRAVEAQPEMHLTGAIDRPDADTVLISCGALRAIDVVDRIEQALGKPVICSNQAMLWDCLRQAGIKDRLPGLGRLLRDH